MEQLQILEETMQFWLRRIYNNYSWRFEADICNDNSMVIFNSVSKLETKVSIKDYSKANLIDWHVMSRKKDIPKLQLLNKMVREIAHLVICEYLINNSHLIKFNIFSPLMSKVTHLIHILGFKISRKQFERILIITHKIRDLKFNFCKISTEGLDLSKTSPAIDFCLKDLRFFQCTESERPILLKKFERIFASISRCTLRSSLETVCVYPIRGHENTAQEMVQTYNLGHINIQMWSQAY
ncbi:unnamed protein product [Moneuplotes crassus]|uniref:Uncharacterized protein n=1 Tax=Euplotes crassus TaxID=5936 RepID=A0AAD2CX84_EUPCR|nr:unnamed protein product [Moneuplotes crassus]